ncbi:hypothetical protein ACJIZ3_007856 [Penstemon smallii]|uniref:Pentatricopeptide repeat-containing protein n=1 Tax=Penstemon smallii TaxID=265156 RepID=A0ABD3T851_9LAMI
MITAELFLKLFQQCKTGKCLTQLHSHTIKSGLTHNTLFAAKLVELYSNFTLIQTTRKLFDEMPHRTVYIWNLILKCYYREKNYKESLVLFSQMFSSQKPDLYTIPIALKSCAVLKALEFGEIIHGFVKKSDGIGTNLFVGSALIEFYSKCGEMDNALCVFEEYPVPDTVIWTTMITGYEQNNEPKQALEFFSQMVRAQQNVLDPVTLISVVSACVQMLNINVGRSVHGFMIRFGFDNVLSLSNALLNLYGKTGFLNYAANLFKTMEKKDVISWGSVISCYAHHGSGKEALDLFDMMISKGIEPNVVVLISALQACEAIRNLEVGKRIHEIAARKRFDLNIMISTALIDMYMNCSSPYEAINVFERMQVKDSVCYSNLLCGCHHNGMWYKSMEIFKNMLASEVKPSSVDMVKIFTVCSELGVLQYTSCIHGFAIKLGVENNSYLSASLIESYAKCGSLDDSIGVFNGIKDGDVVIWSSVFAAYGLHGKGHEALELFNQMIKHTPIKPNDVSFVSILSACSHAGLVKEGIDTFNMMVNVYNQNPNSKHYGIMVDLLGRIGELDKAMEFIEQIQGPVGANEWGSLLGASRIYQNTQMGEVAARKLVELDPNQTGHYILLSNIYAVDEKWDNVAEVRKVVKERKLKKVSGQSVIELRDEVCSFIANDRSHQNCELIYELLMSLEGKMKEECNVNSMDFSLHEA